MCVFFYRESEHKKPHNFRVYRLFSSKFHNFLHNDNDISFIMSAVEADFIMNNKSPRKNNNRARFLFYASFFYSFPRLNRFKFHRRSDEE